jgi:hypothetical protein
VANTDTVVAEVFCLGDDPEEVIGIEVEGANATLFSDERGVVISADAAVQLAAKLQQLATEIFQRRSHDDN